MLSQAQIQAALAKVSSKEQEQALLRLLTLVDDLYKHWQPHTEQVGLLAAMLQGKTDFALEWGRRGGKGDVFIAAAALWGQIFPGSNSYYFAPLLNEGVEIMWANNKIEAVVPGNWIDTLFQSEHRAYWANSALGLNGRTTGWWKLDGCDKFDRRRGIEPKRGIIQVDELREIQRQFVSEVITPTRARWYSPFMVATTPPDSLVDEDDPEKPHWALALIDEIRANPRGYYSHMVSAGNPHLSGEFLADEEAKLRARGEDDVWQREYLAMRVPRKTGRQFPMFGPQHIRPHADLVRMVKDHPDDWRLFCMTDPAGADVWAWNLFAVNLYDKRMLCLAEIDETNHAEMVTTLIWPRVMQQMHEVEPRIDLWRKHYDDAEAWFAREMTSKYQVAFNSSEKLKMGKREAFSLIKDLFLADMFFISDSCHHTIWEFQNYENEKSRDHHLDLSRYTIHVSGYTPNSITKPQNIPVHSGRKMQKIRQAQVVTESSATGDEAFSGWADSLCSGFD